MDQEESSNTNDHEEQRNVEVQRKNHYFLELALLFLFIGNNLISTLLQNQIIKQRCLELGYNSTICDKINESKNDTREIEEKIQPYVASLNSNINLIHTIIPAVLSLFLGNWSDLYGRKKILISTFSGYTLTLSSFAAVCYYSEVIDPLPPWIYVFCYLPASLLGGWPSLLTAALCYTTDHCEQSMRAKRLTIIELIVFFGVLLGTFSCSFLLRWTNSPATVFIISSSLALFATLILIVFVNESSSLNSQDSVLQKAKNLVSPIIIINLLKTCFKRRSFKGRQMLLLLIIIMTLLVFTFNGGSVVGYLFVREKFSWTLEQYNLYESYSIVCSIVGSFIGIAFLKKILKLSEMNLACVALFCGVADAFLKAFLVFETWHMYAITSITLFRILSSPMCRTMIAFVVPQDEIGKVFSITTSFEALSTFVASPLYKTVYNATFTFFPGAFFVITGVVNIFGLCIALYITYLTKIRESLINPYQQIQNN